MWRYLAGAAATLLIVAAGFLMGRSLSGDAAQSAPAPAIDASDPLAPAMAFGTIPEPPRASDLSKEEKRFNRYDRDKNGAVSRDEYLENRKKAYARLDKDGDGRLSFEEYAVKTADKFGKADRDRSTSLNRAEFSTTRVIRKSPPKCECSRVRPKLEQDATPLQDTEEPVATGSE